MGLQVPHNHAFPGGVPEAIDYRHIHPMKHMDDKKSSEYRV